MLGGFISKNYLLGNPYSQNNFFSDKLSEDL